jgi:hypothetical protein
VAQRSVLVGRYAECAVDLGSGLTVVVLCTDWKVKYSTKAIETTAHGDIWERNIAGRASWTFTAKGWIVPGSAAHYPNNFWSSGAAPLPFKVAGYSGGAPGGAMSLGTKIFEGTGVPVEGTLDVGMELAVQDWEIKGDGPPTAGV